VPVMKRAILPDWKWKANFLISFVTGNRAFAAPFTAAIDITRRCNLNCFGCRTHAPDRKWQPNPCNDDFAFEDFLRICAELRQMRTRKMILIGEGEPMLHSRLPEMIHAAKLAGLYLVLVTNGTLLDESRAQSLVKSGLDELRISLWAADEDEYRHNYGGADPRFFRRVLDGARTIVKLRREYNQESPRIVLHRPIDKEHFRNLGRMADIAREAGCDELSFSPLKPMGGSEERRALAPEEESELIGVLNHLDQRARSQGLATNISSTKARYRIGRDVWKDYPCYIGWIDVRIRTNGDVLACAPCRQVLGNIRDKSLTEIWNDVPFRRFRAQTKTRSGLAQVAETCSCGYCCHVLANAQLHRLLRWLPRVV
jgi:MoaA/NifB/PqqE/SkfB family radical SAM enzyme